MSMSDAERRRQERRQRILNNQGARLQKILGPHSNFSLPAEDLSSSSDQPCEEESTATISKTTTTASPFEFLDNRDSSAFKDCGTGHTITSNNENSLLGTSNFTPVSQNRHADVTTGQPSPHDPRNEPKPKISMKQHHLFLFLLSLSLTICGADYFLLYLIIYEITLVAISGFSLPSFYFSKNALFTVFLLYGVPEVYRKTFQEAAILLNWFTTDLTIFISSALLLPLVHYVTA